MKTSLVYVLCGLSFFRARWSRRPLYKSARSKTNKEKTVPIYDESVSTARRYFRRARAAGFRGSIREQLRLHDRASLPQAPSSDMGIRLV